MSMDLRSYTVATAELLGVELHEDEIDAVVGQVERVAQLVDRLPRTDDDTVTMTPRFEP